MFLVDYVCLGNHEFDHGEEELKKRIKESKFKWLNSNILQNQKILDGTKEFEILSFDNIVKKLVFEFNFFLESRIIFFMYRRNKKYKLSR